MILSILSCTLKCQSLDITWRLFFLCFPAVVYETGPWQAKMFRHILCKVIHSFLGTEFFLRHSQVDL